MKTSEIWSLPKNESAPRIEWAAFRGESRPVTLDFGFHEEDGPKFQLPPFQRDLVWSEGQNIKFIESIFQRLPLGVYCVNCSPDHPETDYWLLDGQQRWNAIYRFVEDRFPVQGLLFSEMHVADRRKFMMTPFPCLETTLEDVAQLEEIFRRLAYGGVPNL